MKPLPLNPNKWSNPDSEVELKPLLRWAGGKRKMINKLLNNLPPTNSYRRYVEPFAGGAALFLSKSWPSPILADANAELINFYNALKHRRLTLIKILESFPLSDEKFYYALREMTSERDWVFRAARFYYLNRYCFNGLYRENTKGMFNVPFNSKKGFPLYQKEEFNAVAKVLRRTALRVGDFRQTLCSLEPEGSFAYLDPPYFHYYGAKSFRKYTKDQFTETDHNELADILRWWDRKGGLFLMSNSGASEIDRLYASFYKVRLHVRRWIACNGQRQLVEESLIANYPIRFWEMRNE
ncbi:Dam family site-specific DNA-(adenine-N6)-methyltransferase [bacterium]|nr:Dam family site-specific DNA-(adenine-N6)-methyltransferase [bacterium]